MPEADVSWWNKFLDRICFEVFLGFDQYTVFCRELFNEHVVNSVTYPQLASKVTLN